MNGAHALLATLSANGVTTCFANPGTSEMHVVGALDDVTDVRSVLCLFEGVATGAADGYARVTGAPAATLLHLGPGLANGWANLHNARRAQVPLLNIVGDHATYHAVVDAPLQSNIEMLAGALEGWYGRPTSPNDVAASVAAAITAAFGPPARVATLALPADASWGEIDTARMAWPLARRPSALAFDDDALGRTLSVLRSKRCTFLLGGTALMKDQLSLAQRVASVTSSRLMMENFATIMDRGAGVASPERVIYVSEFAVDQLKDTEALILVGSKAPVGFFAYPHVPSRLAPESCEVVALASPGSDTLGALQTLVDALKAPPESIETGEPPGAPTGELTPRSLCAAVGATLREGVIVADESNTSGVHLFGETRFSPEHRWMTLTGGAIGYGLPVAVGAAIGSKRRVLALESDGSMMYTLQALWTMARESLDVTVVALSNRSYAVLTWERQRVGPVAEGAPSERLLALDNPTLSLAALASAQGVPSVRVTTADELVQALERSYDTPGPSFIEAMLPTGLN